MKAVTVAKKDYRDAVQSRALWSLVAVFVVLTLISAYAFVEAPELFGGPGDPTFEGPRCGWMGSVGRRGHPTYRADSGQSRFNVPSLHLV